MFMGIGIIGIKQSFKRVQQYFYLWATPCCFNMKPAENVTWPTRSFEASYVKIHRAVRFMWEFESSARFWTPCILVNINVKIFAFGIWFLIIRRGVGFRSVTWPFIDFTLSWGDTGGYVTYFVNIHFYLLLFHLYCSCVINSTLMHWSLLFAMTSFSNSSYNLGCVLIMERWQWWRH